MTDNSSTQDPLTALENVLKEKQPAGVSQPTAEQADPVAEEAKAREDLVQLEQQSNQTAATEAAGISAELAALVPQKPGPAAESAEPSPQPTTQPGEDDGNTIRQLDHTKV